MEKRRLRRWEEDKVRMWAVGRHKKVGGDIRVSTRKAVKVVRREVLKLGENKTKNVDSWNAEKVGRRETGKSRRREAGNLDRREPLGGGQKGD